MQTPRDAELGEGDLLTIRQALEIMPVSKSLLYELVAQGRIPAVRVRTLGSRRGRILIARQGLEKFVKQSRVGGAS